MLLGCIADDFTGATDLANNLVRAGMRTVQTIGLPAAGTVIDADAVVVALKSRTVPAAEAVSASRAALEWLRAAGCRQFYFKYCSTFDSTDAGNIGPVTEALLDALGSDFTIACPAFPATERTIYRGHLFVGDALLSESGMQHHPLTPMTDPNLVRVLGRQMTGRVGLLAYDALAAGVEATRSRIAALRADGVRVAIADSLHDADLATLAAACADLPLVTAGSGLAIGLPANFRARGELPASGDGAFVPAVDGPAVVLAGSCSSATLGQVARFRADHPALRLDPMTLGDGGSTTDDAVAFALQAQRRGQTPMLYASADPDAVKAAQRALGHAEAGRRVEQAMADCARALRAAGTHRFVVAGGETSGAVVQALGITALRIGAQIDPGVPWTASLDDPPIALALKSGNFGAPDFFAKSLAMLDADAP